MARASSACEAGSVKSPRSVPSCATALPSSFCDVVPRHSTTTCAGWQPSSEHSGYRLGANASSVGRTEAALAAATAAAILHPLGSSPVPIVSLHGILTGTPAHEHTMTWMITSIAQHQSPQDGAEWQSSGGWGVCGAPSTIVVVPAALACCSERPIGGMQSVSLWLPSYLIRRMLSIPRERWAREIVQGRFLRPHTHFSV